MLVLAMKFSRAVRAPDATNAPDDVRGERRGALS
jgi:hypothetical protein